MKTLKKRPFRAKTLLICGLFGAFIASCTPYSPEQQAQPESGGSEQTTLSVGKLSEVNPTQQICNASISQDTVLFPGAMLWLNFSGDLQVGDHDSSFEPKSAKQHDRLTISGAQNEVLWHLMMEDVPAIECEFQDPEWSTHPSYLVTLGAWSEVDNCDNEMTHGGFLVRPVDRAVLQINNGSLNAVATPHLWVTPSHVPDTNISVPSSPQFSSNGFVTPAEIQNFLGSSEVKIVYSENQGVLSLKFVDYSTGSSNIQSLNKPVGKANWKAESALISPDGQWVTYHIFESPAYYESYIQELRVGSTPIRIAQGAADPHWWVHPTDPTRIYVQYVKRPSGAGYIVKEDLGDAAVIENESAGTTWKQELKLAAGAPLDIAVEFVGAPSKIAPLPMKGGRSPDGKFLATGTNYGYLLEMN